MNKIITFMLTLFLAGFTLAALLVSPTPAPAGDICEYYGITETVLSHSSLDLRTTDIVKLEQLLKAPYYQQWYCYLPANNGKRYPIHFPAYSMLAIPIRLILEVIHIDPLKTFAVTNLFGATTIALLIISLFGIQNIGALTIITLLVTSPLLSFITWPGPDLLTMMLLLYGILCILMHKNSKALFVLAIASWNSQPLIIPTLFAGYLVLSEQTETQAMWKRITIVMLSIGVISIPYLYNIAKFGTLTPWTILPDWWTKTYGFGIQNVRFGKFIEQLVDVNIGIFWYAPILTLVGIYSLLTAVRNHKIWVGICLITALTLLAYQTNPAWHYGTSGYGPSRHAIVLIPFFIAALVWNVKKKSAASITTGLILISQIYILSINNYIFPVFTNTLFHTPVASFVLDHWPQLYNPTPEIFIDRTNHTDLDHTTTAIYIIDGKCKKAYVLLNDIDRLTNTCGYLPRIQGSIIQPNRDGVYVNYE